MYEVATHGAMANGGLSVCDFEEVYHEVGVGWAVYGSVLFIASNSPATIVSDVLMCLTWFMIFSYPVYKIIIMFNVFINLFFLDPTLHANTFNV